MRVIHGIILVGACSDLSIGTRIDYFAAAEGGSKDLAIAPAAVDASGAETAHGNHALGTVEARGCVIGIRSAQVHSLFLLIVVVPDSVFVCLSEVSAIKKVHFPRWGTRTSLSWVPGTSSWPAKETAADKKGVLPTQGNGRPCPDRLHCLRTPLCRSTVVSWCITDTLYE